MATYDGYTMDNHYILCLGRNSNQHTGYSDDDCDAGLNLYRSVRSYGGYSGDVMVAIDGDMMTKELDFPRASPSERWWH